MWVFFFSSRRRHTRCALVTGVQTCALPICLPFRLPLSGSRMAKLAPLIAPSILSADLARLGDEVANVLGAGAPVTGEFARSEEHTSELQSLMRISYAVFCLKKKKKKSSVQINHQHNIHTHDQHIDRHPKIKSNHKP